MTRSSGHVNSHILRRSSGGNRGNKPRPEFPPATALLVMLSSKVIRVLTDPRVRLQVPWNLQKLVDTVLLEIGLSSHGTSGPKQRTAGVWHAKHVAGPSGVINLPGQETKLPQNPHSPATCTENKAGFAGTMYRPPNTTSFSSG